MFQNGHSFPQEQVSSKQKFPVFFKNVFLQKVIHCSRLDDKVKVYYLDLNLSLPSLSSPTHEPTQL